MDSKILLVDDSAILRRIAVNVLSTRGVCGEVITATRATEGFARACTSSVSVVLVDYQIAGMPGADLCRRLLVEHRTSRIPVILLLGPGMVPPGKDTLPANIVDFLVKPFTPEQLVGAVKAALNHPLEEVPISRLREPVAAVARPGGTVNTSHEVAAAVNVTALVRRETNRLLYAQSATRQAAMTTPTIRETPGGRSQGDPTRLRTAFVAAVNRQETGAFRVTIGNGPGTDVYLENGQVVVVATTDAARYSEDADGVVPSKVSPAALEEVVAEQAQTGVPFFLSLGARGLLSKAAATGLLHQFGQRHFAQYWAAPPESLAFQFVAMDALPGFALRLEPHRESLDEWLLGSLRHLSPEDVAAAARHEGLAGIPSFKPEGTAILSSLRLDEAERDFCRQIGARRDLAAMAKNLGISTEHAYLLLFRLRCLGIADYRANTSAFVVTPRTSVRRVLPLHR